MLKIITTPHLQGVSLQGDYEDLNALYDAIGRYLDFYQRHSEGYPYHEYEYLLSLNYDIRHAYMGTRDYTVAENNCSNYGAAAEGIYEPTDDFNKEIHTVRNHFKNGNLYYSVNILYPLIFHYLASFERILADYYLDSWFEPDNEDTSYYLPYDEIKATHDRAQITLLTSLLWDNLFELFGKEKALAAFHYCGNQSIGSAPSLYIDALLHHQGAVFDHLSEAERRSYLYLAFLEVLDSDELLKIPERFPKCSRHYQTALALYEENAASRSSKTAAFPTQKAFYREFQKAFRRKRGITEDEFDDFLEKQFGPCPDDEPEW